MVYSWIRVVRPIGTLREEELPCLFAVVELDRGCRMIGRLEGATRIEIGDRIVASFVDWQDWTEIRFRPEESFEEVSISGVDL